VIDKLIRILVVEDHHVVRKGLVALLKAVPGFAVVGEAADGVEAITQFRLCRPDITVIDLRLPGLSGVEVVKSIRQESRHARFIVLTTFDGEEDIYRAWRAGVRSYLLKGSTAAELVAAIRIVNEGRSHVPPEIFEKLARRLEAEDLTPRETEVLQYIVQGRSNKQIAALLAISQATVKAHINSLLNRLGVSDRTQAATTAIQRGIVSLDSHTNKTAKEDSGPSV
jgi:two-component system NarL family response regulator